MTSGVRIDAMRPEDLDAVLAIDLATRERGALAPGAEDLRAARARHFTEELARPWAHLYVARDAGEAGEVVGYLLLWHVVDEIHLLDVAVAEHARRRGTGRALMDHMLAFAGERAAAKVLLEVRVSNAPAIALYRSLGFEELNLRQRYYADGEDGLEMILAPVARGA